MERAARNNGVKVVHAYGEVELGVCEAGLYWVRYHTSVGLTGWHEIDDSRPVGEAQKEMVRLVLFATTLQERLENVLANKGHERPSYCLGETCKCGRPAYHKLAEDGVRAIEHPLTSYVCCPCFAALMGPVAAKRCGLDYTEQKCTHPYLDVD